MTMRKDKTTRAWATRVCVRERERGREGEREGGREGGVVWCDRKIVGDSVATAYLASSVSALLGLKLACFDANLKFASELDPAWVEVDLMVNPQVQI